MGYEKIRVFKKSLYFTIEDLTDLLGIKRNSVKVEICRYVKKGYISRLKRNLFILREKWDNLSFEEIFKIANIIEVPSYISLKSALIYYEITTQIQRSAFESISLKRTVKMNIDETIFNYYKINPKYYKNFIRKDDFFIATKEKSFLDALYLYSFGKYKFDISSIDFEKLDFKILKREIKNYPLKTQKKYLIKDCTNKFYTLLFEIYSTNYKKNLKIEIRKEFKKLRYEKNIAFSPYSNIQVLVNTPSLENIMKIKIESFLNRGEIRNCFDIEFLVKKGISLNIKKNVAKKVLKKIKNFKSVDYKIKLGPIIDIKERDYYVKKNFEFLTGELNKIINL